MKKNKCAVCNEEIVEGFESCWKCDSEEYLSEENNTISHENLVKIERLNSVCIILIILSIIFTIVYLVEFGESIGLYYTCLVILMMFIWCYFLNGIRNLGSSVTYLYKKSNLIKPQSRSNVRQSISNDILN